MDAKGHKENGEEFKDPCDVVPGGVVSGSAALISEASLIRLPLYLGSEQTTEFLFMWSYLSIFSAVKSEKK